MAPVLNNSQSSKNKSNSSGTGNRTRVSIGEALARATTLPWEPPASQTDSDRRRRRPVGSSHPHLTAQEVLQRQHVASSTVDLVDNDNGELSWGSNNHRGESPALAVRPFVTRPSWMSSERPNAPPSQGNGAARGNPPNRQQVANKLASLQDYIEQTEEVMRELRASDLPESASQHVKLSGMLEDLRDSERKLQNLLCTMDNVDSKIDALLGNPPQVASNSASQTEDDLQRRTDEHNRKVQALERQRQELIEMQQMAQQRLAEAEQDRVRLLARASSMNTSSIAGTQLEANLNSITDRLRNERVREASREPSMPAENPEVDQPEAELSDTETDYLLVRDKVAELNTMKAQLAQLQSMMAAIGGADRDNHQGSSATGVSQPRDLQKAERLVGRIQELNRLVEVVRMQGCEEQPEPERQEASVEQMQSMTRELEEQTAMMKAERDRLLQARAELNNMARLAQTSTSDESEAEPPALLPANMSSTPRNVEDGGSRAGSRKGQDGSFLAPPHARQRSTWHNSLPTLVSNDPLDRRSKEPQSSQSSVRNGGSRSRDLPDIDWNFDQFNSEAMFQTQSQLEESSQLCEQMLQESTGGRGVGGGAGSVSSGGPGADLTGILYSQQQMLTRTVSQCCKLIWLQQRQINQLRDAMILQQSNFPPPMMPNAGYYPSTSMQMPFPPQNPFAHFNDPMAARQGAALAARSEDISNSRPHDRPVPRAQDIPDPRAHGSQGPRSHGVSSMAPLGCLSPDEMGPSGALNNQVPPGNRANNYWDNFRSYSRQNLLSTSKSNENVDPRRQAASQERTPQAIVPPNNQSQLHPVVQVHPVVLRDRRVPAERTPFVDMSSHAGPARNSGAGAAKNRTCEVAAHRGEPEGGLLARTGGSRSRRQEDAASTSTSSGVREDPDGNIHRVRNNTGTTMRVRAQPETGWDEAEAHFDSLTRVRNNTGMGARNRTSGPEPVDLPPDGADRPNNRSDAWPLNNRADTNNLLRLPTSVYQEVTSFIRANETRPNYLIQLFRDLQQVSSDPLRQRALQSLQDVVGLNNVALEARNNIRHDNRSNLRRYTDDVTAVDQLFDQLRDNQNTIRQNIGNVPLDTSASNLENPNISNIRELSNPNPRNNLENNRMRDFQSYIEGNLSHAGPGSSLKNPNLSNIRENLAEGLSEYERMNPKNVYLSLYDSLVEDLRRRSEDEFGPVPPPPFSRYLSDIPHELLMQDGGDVTLEVNRRANRDMDLDDRRGYRLEDRHGPRLMDVQNRRANRQGFMGANGENMELNDNESRKRTFLCSHFNPGDDVGMMSAGPSRTPDWPPQVDSPFTMFVRPVRYAEPTVLPTDDADLAEADQTRSIEGESLAVVLNRLTTEEENDLPEELQTEDSPTEDTMAGTQPESTHSINADSNENLVSNESNIAKPVCSVVNRRDVASDGTKVVKARLQDVLSGAGEVEGGAPTPMMDIAGALEHLNDYMPQRGEIAGFVDNDPYLGMEVEAEREAGLDQVPTRLQKSDSPSPERDDPI